jgi:hypothetical protein
MALRLIAALEKHRSNRGYNIADSCRQQITGDWKRKSEQERCSLLLASCLKFLFA